MFKQCVICGKEFETKGNSKTCSDTCRVTLRKATQYLSSKNWKANNHERTLGLNRKSHARHREQLKEYDRQWYLANRPIIFIRAKLKRIDEGKKVKPFCCVCGKSFNPKFYREHFCSDECRYSSPLYRILMDKFSEAGL